MTKWYCINLAEDKLVGELFFNGYVVDERLLEDVIFKIQPTADGKDLIVNVTDDCADYFNKLNKKKLLSEVKDAVKKYDVFSLTEDMTDDDGVLYDADKPFYEQEASIMEKPYCIP